MKPNIRAWLDEQFNKIEPYKQLRKALGNPTTNGVSGAKKSEPDYEERDRQEAERGRKQREDRIKREGR